jgi:hypothetical protein
LCKPLQRPPVRQDRLVSPARPPIWQSGMPHSCPLPASYTLPRSSGGRVRILQSDKGAPHRCRFELHICNAHLFLSIFLGLKNCLVALLMHVQCLFCLSTGVESGRRQQGQRGNLPKQLLFAVFGEQKITKVVRVVYFSPIRYKTSQ